MENLLKYEKSPYLKQHENNPVHWYPWGKKAINKAKELKKPIFLSVGYASCHWCHVMAHESFENFETAKIMNNKFINIKVDREERPDLDFVFQKSLSILTGTQGGWPLSMFLDENGVPFTGGTYFPPKEMYGRPDFMKILNSASEVYSKNREKIIQQKTQIRVAFDQLNRKSSVINQNLLPYVEQILPHLDKDYGGFIGAPKFPQFYIFDTLFYFYKKSQNIELLNSVETLLKNICARGLYDHLGGGISRYTVDDKWIVPHFEKMLYDNILFVNLLTNFFQHNQNHYYKNKLNQTVRFLLAEFINKEGLLGSAYDADSEGEEGKFYVWTYKELNEVLDKDIELFNRYYDISENGNWESKNILIEKSLQDSNLNNLSKLEILKSKLLEARQKRQKPFFDDKTQTDLNSFWITTLLHTSFVLNDETLLKKSIQMFELLEKRLSKKFFHCYESEKNSGVFLEDYAYYCQMLITLYECTSDERYLKQSEQMMNDTWALFYDEKNQILQKNPVKQNDLFVNPVDINDNNISNGNSIFLNVSQKLELITEKKEWKTKVEDLSKTFHSYINLNSTQMFSYLKYLDIVEEKITFTFFGDIKKMSDLNNFVIKKFLNSATIIYKKSDKNHLLACKRQTCSLPIDNIDSLKEYLKKNSIN